MQVKAQKSFFCFLRQQNAVTPSTAGRNFKTSPLYVLLWRGLVQPSRFPHHKETIILIRKISVLWFFYWRKRGILLFFIGFTAKIQACRDSFHPRKPFLFLAVKYKSFTLYPFRSIYGVSFNLYIEQRKILILVGFCGIINSPINKNLRR